MSHPPEPVDTFSLLRPRAGDPPNIRALRVAVLTMGAILIAGFGAVIARIVYLTTRPPADGLALTSAPQPTSKVALETTLALPQGAKIQSQSVSGNRLSVHYVASDDEAILILDLETGQTIGRVRIPSMRK
jgi:hypothetical protein